MAAAAIERFGRIDAVFANAGFGATRGFLEESVEHWRSMVLTNVYGVALTIRATLPHLLERGDGHFVDHQLGRRPPRRCRARSTRRRSGRRPRSARACARSCARCTTTTTIRVTLIEPGMTDTPFFDNRPGRVGAAATTTSPAR